METLFQELEGSVSKQQSDPITLDDNFPKDKPVTRRSLNHEKFFLCPYSEAKKRCMQKNGKTKRDAVKLFKKIKNSIFPGFTFLAALIFCSVTFAIANTYPTDGWQSSTPEKQGMRSQMLANMIEEIKMKGYNIDNISIIRNGYMVLE